MNFERILVRATNWVGDAVMSVPALQKLRERFPDARISILARPWVAELYEREPFCDEVIPYSGPKGWRGISEKRELVRQLKERSFDCAILLQNAFEAAALAWAARIPVRIGYERDGRGVLLTHSIRKPAAGETPRHERYYYLELLKRAGLISGYELDQPIRLAGASSAAQRGRERFLQANVRGPVVGVSPGAAYGGAKRWLPERFAEAAVTVAKQRNASVAVFGTNDERDVCETVCAHVEAEGAACREFAGATTLSQFIEYAAACDVYLTNDSGPMHIASALGVPTVVIFGATDETATGPTGSWTRVVRERVPCSPCLKRECPIDHPCMRKVEARRVAETALRLLESRN